MQKHGFGQIDLNKPGINLQTAMDAPGLISMVIPEGNITLILGSAAMFLVM